MAKKSLEIFGVGTGIMVLGRDALNAIGEKGGYGKLGDKAIESGIRKAGLHKEDFERRAALRLLEEQNKALRNAVINNVKK